MIETQVQTRAYYRLTITQLLLQPREGAWRHGYITSQRWFAGDKQTAAIDISFFSQQLDLVPAHKNGGASEAIDDSRAKL